MIDTHLKRAAILHHCQEVEYELCVTWANGLNKKIQSYEEKCDMLQLDAIEGKKTHYKIMYRTVDNYASIELIFAGRY